MKKLTLTIAILLNMAFAASAIQTEQTAQTAKVASLKHQTVRMYRQPGLKAEVMKNLSASDEVLVVRKHDAKWSIVTVNGEAGYVLTSSLKVQQMQPQSEGGRTAAANK